MEGREKRIFDAVADYRAGKEVDLTKFFGGVHGEFIVDVAMSLAFDLRKRYLVMVENRGRLRICLTMPWLKFLPILQTAELNLCV